jgi:hypothetical protein
MVTGQHSNQLNYVPTAFSTTYRKVLISLAVLTVYPFACVYYSTRYNRIPGFMDSIDSKKNLSELPSHKRPQTRNCHRSVNGLYQRSAAEIRQPTRVQRL